MKVVKRAITDDRKTRIMFDIFDSIITRLEYPWKMERIEFLINDKNSVFVGENMARITTNYNDNIIEDMDKKAMFAMILHGLYHIIIRDKYRLSDLEAQIPHFVEDVITNREMIKHGHDDFVFYLSYLYLIRKKHVADIEDYLDINVPWLSFYKLDEYNSKYLKELLVKIKDKEKFKDDSEKLIDLLKKDITKESELNHALNAYEVLLCRY